MIKRIIVMLATLLLGVGVSIAAPPFSGPEDVAFAEKLWHVLKDNRIVGPNRFQGMPYSTPPPHGQFVETLDGQISIDGREGLVLVKKNFGKTKKETREEIADNPDKFMTSITVMFKREKGYDSENKDWYWVKYYPDGSLFKNPKGMKLAGRVAKGKSKGCIACHSLAPGGDFIYIHDRYSN